MDGNLFLKYKKQIQKQGDKKTEIIELIKKETNQTLTNEDFEIKGKEIVLYISSAKKAILMKKNIKETLRGVGYALR